MTPLYKKLGLKSGHRVFVINYPAAYSNLFDEFPEDIKILKIKPRRPIDFIHLFVSNFRELERYYFMAKDLIKIDGTLWISWPKGDQRGDISRDVIRRFGLANGLVDVKVVSINDHWSGLKFVYRLKDR